MKARCRAILFDLYGTLIDNYSVEDYRQLCRESAELLGVDYEGFYRLWEPTFHRRARGIEGDTAWFLREACAALGHTPTAEAIEANVALRLDWSRRFLASRPWSAAALARIRAAGYPLALVSDCTWELPLVWPEAELARHFHSLVFSCEEKTKKPDPRMFTLAAERLGVEPRDCWYIGDGGGDELTAASALGMRTIQLEMSHELDVMTGGYPRQEWHGPRVKHIDEILALLGL